MQPGDFFRDARMMTKSFADGWRKGKKKRDMAESDRSKEGKTNFILFWLHPCFTV